MADLQKASGLSVNSMFEEVKKQNPGVYSEADGKIFKEWFKKTIKAQRSEQGFWKDLGSLYVDYGIEKDRFRQSPEKDLSHFWPKSQDGAPFTFLEDWAVNQKRKAIPFASKENLRKLGIPTNNKELIDAVLKQEKNQELTPLGIRLEDIGGYEAYGLARGETPEQIIHWRKEIDRIQDVALDDPDLIPSLNPYYREAVLNYRGPGNEVGRQGTQEMLKDVYKAPDVELDKTTLAAANLGDLEARKEVENMLNKYGEVDLQEDINYIKKYMEDSGQPYKPDPKFGQYDNFGGGGGPGPGTNISPNPKSVGAGLLGTGLTIKGLAGEAGFAALNRETGENLGVIASGKGDMSNVRGAATGIGKDLIGGGIVSGGLKAGQFGLKQALIAAGKKGATHFTGKALLGKAVPYAGLAFAAYGLYDTADAFVKGYSEDNRGITDRILDVDYGGIVEDVFSDKNSIFRRGKEQDMNFATM